MSYVKPTASALTFSWEGASAYTKPSANALEFSWEESAPAVGAALYWWNSTSFVLKPLKRWTGIAWEIPPASSLKRWNGTSYV